MYSESTDQKPQRSFRFDLNLPQNEYEHLLTQREAKRAQLQHASSLKNQTLKGTCTEKCPVFERHERELHLDLSEFEIIPETKNNKLFTYPRIDHAKAVKKYHRPAAGNEEPLPEDVRTPQALRESMDYLLDNILKLNAESFIEKYHFVRDRTRSIRQDFTLQSIKDNMFVEINEEIARFHILSGHLLCEFPKAKFDSFQNTEQLRKVLTSLDEIYTDIRKGKYHQVTNVEKALKNEPEFRSYYLLTHLQDKSIYRKTISFHSSVFESSHVQFVLRCCSAYLENDFYDFFRLSFNSNIFEYSLLSEIFPQVRINSCQSIRNSFNSTGVVPLKYFYETLKFEDEQECEEFFNSLKIPVENGNVFLQQSPNDLNVGQIKKRVGLKFMKNVPTNDEIAGLIRGKSKFSVEKQLDKKNLAVDMTAILAAETLRKVVLDQIEREISLSSISTQLTESFFEMFFESEFKLSLLQYCSKISGNIDEFNKNKFKIISNNIFDILFQYFIKEIINEECAHLIKVNEFLRLLPVNRIVKSFRRKQNVYANILAHFKEKVTYFRNNHFRFVSVIQNMPVALDFIEVCYDLDFLLDAYSNANHLVLFCDNLNLAIQYSDFLHQSGVAFTIVFIHFGNLERKYNFCINFYVISDWINTLNGLFSALESLKNPLLLVKNLIDVQQFSFQLFDEIITNGWNFFENTKCSCEDAIFLTCNVKQIIENMFHNFYLKFKALITLPFDSFSNLFTKQMENISKSTLASFNNQKVCCLYHLSKSTFELSRTSFHLLQTCKRFFFEEELFQLKHEMSELFDSFLMEIMQTIYFSPIFNNSQQIKNSDISFSIDDLQKKVQEEKGESYFLNSFHS